AGSKRFENGGEPGGKGLLRERNPNIREMVIGDGQIVIASSEADQISWESKNYPNGVFTRQLIDALRARPTISDAYAYMKDKVYQEVLRDRGVQQRPVLIKQWVGPDPALQQGQSQNHSQN
ncbi:MAG TPA: caspase family protein, partial [Chroococcales cyanobacterium]